jgi:NADH-quinone oxidoreductase subunit M
MIDAHLLTLIVFVPILGLLVVLAIPGAQRRLIRITAAVFTFLVFVLSTYLFLVFDRTNVQMQFVEHYRWIPQYNIWYYMGVDGLSVILIFLTGLLSFLATFAAWNIEKAVKGYYAMYLLLVTGMMGVFCALDFFLFYVFWEIMLLPMYFLIGVWGGPKREYAAIKFFIYTLVGSVLILLVILAFYFKTGSFDMLQRPFKENFLFEKVLFFALFIGFAIKVPVFPFHTWLPDAHVEAPTAISVILAGVLLKMGGYGLLRISYPMLPDVAWDDGVRYFLACLGLVNIIYGALCAMAQTDFKKLVAYSSISHMGFVILGIAVLNGEALNGAVYQMFNHGCSSAMLFLLVGVIYDRAHHRELSRFGGLGTKMPIYLTLSIVGFFASLGLPGTANFISEIMVFLGSYRVYRGITIAALLGIILTAAYILWTVERVYLGKLKPEYEAFSDCNRREIFTLAPLAILLILFGILPNLVLDVFRESMQYLINLVTLQ